MRGQANTAYGAFTDESLQPEQPSDWSRDSAGVRLRESEVGPVEFFRQLARGITQAWQSLTTSARVQIVLAAVATVVAVSGVVFYGGRPQYVDLYRGLPREDSSAIISYLSERGVAYKVEDDGATILVPVRNQQQVRIDLAAKDLPKSHGASSVGFELLDKQNIMTNQWLQDVNYRRAVEGELQRFLLDFDFIKKAAVHISESKDELFASDQKPSKAAVSIDVSRTPSPAERKALLAIISSFGGANLDQKHITLTTFDGTPLYLPPADEFASVANSQLEYIHELESHREEKARKALLDMGINAVVKVSADVDFSSSNEKTEQAFDGTPLSESSTTTTTTTNESLPEGPVGATQNVPEGTVKPGGTKTEENVEDTITNYQPSTKTIEKKVPAGAVKKYVVAATIEGTYGKPDASGAAAYTPPTEEVKTACKSIILASVGPGVRPEDITLSDMSFRNGSASASNAPAAAASSSTVQTVVNYAISAGKVILVLLGFVVVRNLLRSLFRPPVEEEVEEEAVVDVGEQRRRTVAESVDRLSTERPDAAAALLRTWMQEGKD